MVSINAVAEDLFNDRYPVTDDLPDLCTILSPTSTTKDAKGHSTSADSSVATGVPIRIDPALGRFNRIEGILHEQSVNADFIATIAYRAGVTEKMRIKVTTTDNAEWLNEIFEIVLVMDGGGQHESLDLLLNQVKVAGVPV